MITELNERAQSILKQIIDSYMDTGEPVGSRTLSKTLGLDLSAATIRNVMSDLESLGLLYAPHTSAGRMPTQEGLRLYVDGLMEVGDLSPEEQNKLDPAADAQGFSINQLMERTITTLSGLSSCAGMVVAPKTDKPLRHIQFVKLDAKRILVVLVMQDGMVENRVMELEENIPDFALVSASNYLNSKIAGKTLLEAQSEIFHDIELKRAELDTITSALVKQGLAIAPQTDADGHIIVRGQSHLLGDLKAVEDLERARHLLATLEEQEAVMNLLKDSENAEGVQIYIGSENKTFESSGWSMVISPYRTPDKKIIGAIGVIGPTRLNYSRIIPMVDYTSKIMEKLINR